MKRMRITITREV